MKKLITKGFVKVGEKIEKGYTNFRTLFSTRQKKIYLQEEVILARR